MFARDNLLVVLYVCEREEETEEDIYAEWKESGLGDRRRIPRGFGDYRWSLRCLNLIRSEDFISCWSCTIISLENAGGGDEKNVVETFDYIDYGKSCGRFKFRKRM